MSHLGIEATAKRMHQDLEQAYELFDNRGKGYISQSDLIENMKQLGYEVDKKQIAQMVQHLDESNKGHITKDAFMKFMSARLDYRDDPEELKFAFDYFDGLSKGFIKFGDLNRVAEQLGENTEQCHRIMSQADKDENGELNIEEFLRAIKKTSYF